MRTFTFSVALLLVAIVNAQLPAFNPADQPAAPDYAKAENWSALPFREDAADDIPKTETWVSDSLKPVDVFYIYPTIYVKGKTWNANLANKKLNKKIDRLPVRYHASVFNASAQVYAPRYRQAELSAFSDTVDGPKALDFAYQDVKRAFLYYLQHYNNGRPIIIASHSQGTHHARRLLREFFDTTTLQKQLVAAYTIGFAFYEAQYKTLKPCTTATQNGCYITWASYRKGYEPGETVLAGDVCINPLTWNRDTIAVDKSKSIGAMLLSFNKIYSNNVSAQIHNNILWVRNTMPILSTWTNLHVADYNLFWYDIRANVKVRVEEYLKRNR